jgi:hypothetical protein
VVGLGLSGSRIRLSLASVQGLTGSAPVQAQPSPAALALDSADGRGLP